MLTPHSKRAAAFVLRSESESEFERARKWREDEVGNFGGQETGLGFVCKRLDEVLLV